MRRSADFVFAIAQIASEFKGRNGSEMPVIVNGLLRLFFRLPGAQGRRRLQAP
jgi:hypothetical protein